MKRIALAGGSGFVGAALQRHWAARGVETIRLVRRTPQVAGEIEWDPSGGRLDGAALAGCTALVNLAGENIGAGRWTADRKAVLRASRVESTALLARTVAAGPWRPEVWLNASAIGFYGDTGEREVDESAPRGDGFLAALCDEWESATQPAVEAGVRVVRLRLGMVLDPAGGVLSRLVPLYRAGLGGPLGNGRMWQSWISLRDVVGSIDLALAAARLVGAVNLVAPEPVRQMDFAAALGRAMRRPAWVRTPAWAMRLAYGEMGRELLLCSQRVRANALLRSGYVFECGNLAQALGGRRG